MNMKKRYTKKQIMESIKYWKNQLRKGNYKKLSESCAKLGLTDNECDLLDGFFTELETSDGNIPATFTIESVAFKDDPGYLGDGPSNYKDMLEKFGPPSYEWLACDYAWYAMDGKHMDELTKAFEKLDKAGLMSCNPNTGVVTFDNKRLTLEDDPDGWKTLAIDGELVNR